MAEIISELDETPVGRYGIRKRLMRMYDENGNAVYSVRDFVPRPVYRDEGEKPETYVPGRGIDLTEDELKAVCKALRNNLHYNRMFDKEKAAEKMEAFLADPNTNIYEEPEDDNDPCPEYDYNGEMGLEVFLPLYIGEEKDGITKELNQVSWHNQPIVYDLREFTYKINSRAYKELYPEPDRGISFDDVEAKALCQAGECLFPELRKYAFELKGKYKEKYPNGYYEETEKICFPAAKSQRETVINAIDIVMQDQLSNRISRSSRGSCIGERDSEDLFAYMYSLRQKVINGEPMYNSEIYMCNRIIYEAIRALEGNTTERCMLRNIAEETDDILLEQKRLPDSTYQCKALKRLTASANEFNTLSEILQLLYQNLYGPPEEIKNLYVIRNNIDNLALDDIKSRTEGGKNLNETYSQDPGKHFLEDWIIALNNSAKSPFTERP